jgi:hypothetical protein
MQEFEPMTTIGDRLTQEHRELDELLGRFLGAAHAGAEAAAREALVAFDEGLRRHTEWEEQHVLPEPGGHRLAPADEEPETQRVARELRLEHVQIRELSGMMRRLVETEPDLEGARRLFPNLARRWDAHTTREEAELPRLSD